MPNPSDQPVTLGDALRSCVGEPITNMELREGGYVQFFDNARLEFRANAQNGDTIKITDLGRIAFIKYVGKFPPSSSGKIIIGSSENQNGVHMHAFVEKSMAPVGAKQTVVVVVHDNLSNAVNGARVSLVLEYPSGRKEALSSGLVAEMQPIVCAEGGT